VNTNDTSLALDATPRCTPNLRIRSAGSEHLVQNSASGHVHILNSLAGLVLRHCDGKTPLTQIVDDIVAATSVERARAERDILAVCADFRAKGLTD
jgi:hypothetical protein